MIMMMMMDRGEGGRERAWAGCFPLYVYVCVCATTYYVEIEKGSIIIVVEREGRKTVLCSFLVLNSLLRMLSCLQFVFLFCFYLVLFLVCVFYW